MNWWIDGVGIDRNKNETESHTTRSATASSYDCSSSVGYVCTVHD